MATVSQEYLLKNLRYEDGKIYWLPRGYGKFDKQFAGKEAGGLTGLGYKCIAYGNTHILVHQAIWIMHNGNIPDGYEIDHINNDGLDNRIENLRLCLSGQNKYNMRKRKDNTSGVKGVVWNNLNRNWRARIYVDKKRLEVGSFNDINEAQEAIELARIKHHGEYANNGITGIAIWP
jgi:hypothetical protein